MNAQLSISSISELESTAEKFLSLVAPHKKFAVSGEMGAGKTTFIKAVCAKLGVHENTSSPTFAIVHEYAGDKKIFHFDLFRIRNIQELLDLGFEEYLDSDAYIFVEWPDVADPILRHSDFIRVEITVAESGSREIMISDY